MLLRAHIGSLGVRGISADARTAPSIVARRYRTHTLLLAALWRPLLVLWGWMNGA